MKQRKYSQNFIPVSALVSNLVMPRVRLLRPSTLAPPTFEPLLYVPAELVGEYRGQEYTDDGAVETTEHAKHFEEEKSNGNSRFLHRGKNINR